MIKSFLNKLGVAFVALTLAFAPAVAQQPIVVHGPVAHGPALIAFVQLNGTNQYITTPDASVFDFTQTFAVAALVSRNAWAPSAEAMLVDKSLEGAGNGSWMVIFQSSNLPLVQAFADGTNAASAGSWNPAPSLTDGQRYWIGFEFDSDNGSSEREMWTYLGGQGATPSWTLDDNDTRSGEYTIFNSTAQVAIGADSNGSQRFWAGKIYKMWFYSDNLSGIPVAIFDAADCSGSTCTTGSITWTLQNSPTLGAD